MTGDTYSAFTVDTSYVKLLSSDLDLKRCVHLDERFLQFSGLAFVTLVPFHCA